MTIAAVCSPAMLKAFVGAMQVIVRSAISSETEARGIYAWPMCVRSQWISSLTTSTSCLMHNLEVIENKIDFYEERLAGNKDSMISQVEAEKEKSTK